METIDFYYAIGSRYSYLASTQIDALKEETGCNIEWRPISSARLIARRGNSPFEGKPVSGQDEWTYRELDAKRWANFYGVSYLEPRGRVRFDAEWLALASTAAKRLDKGEAYSRSLFAAMFQDSLSEIDERECISLAEACGIAAIDFQAALRAQETVDQLNETIDNAFDAGVFGVPTFVVAGELFWGNDRMILLRHYLAQRQT